MTVGEFVYIFSTCHIVHHQRNEIKYTGLKSILVLVTQSDSEHNVCAFCTLNNAHIQV